MNKRLFCERLKELRKARGLNQDELSDMLGYKERSIISKFENGVHEVPYSVLLRLAEIFKVSPNYLMGYDTPSVDYENLIKKGLDMQTISELSATQIAMVNAYMKALVDANKI